MSKPLVHAVLLLALSPLARAQHGPPPAPAAPITASERHAVIEALAAQVQAHYVFPEAGAKLAAALRAREASGAYAGDGDTAVFGKHLDQDLRTLGDDGHFNVRYDPELATQASGASEPPLPDAEDIARGRSEMAQIWFGLGGIERLPGNVGYIEVRGFGPTELVADVLSAAITVVQGSDALIIDLRRNNGGTPQTVAHLMSHFFPVGDQRHLNDIYSRNDDSTQQFWTNPSVMPRYTKPVYVLTSARTFSGGEEFAYDMQAQKRAILVGETTGGGSNPGGMYPLAHGFAAFIPHSRSINPVTRTNWEHAGVKPDIAVPAAEARKAAHIAALERLVSMATDPEVKADQEAALAKLRAGIVDAPVYTPRH